MLRTALLCAVCAGLVASDTCGYQCTTDKDCGACGGAGRCSSPAAATAFPSIAATCVDAPSSAPAEPKATATDSKWPDQWTADVRGWVYSDWRPKATVAKGKFYYDGTGGHTRADWHPYINGKDAKQVWIGGTGSEKSAYYVKSGPLCIYFHITDPGVGGSVGVEAPDWMKKCDDAGMATYVGREKVDGEWADHYSCHVNYSKVNQTIVFQNWHSLGLGKTAKGLPLRVTGGNSAPNGQKGSPRLSTVWYSNFTTGPQAVKAADFEKPSWLCIPVGEAEAAEFLGEAKLQPAHLGRPELQRRAHYLPHRAPAKADLARARRKVPRAEVAGSSFPEAMAKLNGLLRADRGLQTRSCGAFPLEELLGMQQELFAARSPALQGQYGGDRRSLPYASHGALLQAQRQQAAWAEERPELAAVLRDGLCHELVMMYMHHLSESAREELKSGSFVLPLLPEGSLHPAPGGDDGTAAAAHESYTQKVSCAICHVSKTATPLSVVI